MKLYFKCSDFLYIVLQGTWYYPSSGIRGRQHVFGTYGDRRGNIVSIFYMLIYDCIFDYMYIYICVCIDVTKVSKRCVISQVFGQMRALFQVCVTGIMMCCRYSFEVIEESARYLLTKTRHRPKIGVICGSGLGEFIRLSGNTDYQYHYLILLHF